MLPTTRMRSKTTKSELVSSSRHQTFRANTVESRVPVSVLMLACACFHVRCCLCSSVRHRSGFASYFHTGSGSHVHFRPRPCSSTDRCARLSTHRHLGPHNTVTSVLSGPHWLHRHRMCLITNRLGCPHKLAHAARDGHFSGDSTSEHAVLHCW